MAVVSGHELVERAEELGRLQDALDRLRDGHGGLVVIEAPAGQGKTALVQALREEAADWCRIAAATGGELERRFTFGLVHQLFDAEVLGSDPDRRCRLFAGAGRLAEPVFGLGDAVDASVDVSHARLHGLCWLAGNLAEETPLLLCVDDAHWGDTPSLRFADMLARRAHDLPVLLVVAARRGEPGADQDLLDGLALTSGADVLRPRPLSVAGVEVLIEREVAPEPPAELVRAAYERTGGNPLFLREVLRALRDENTNGGAEGAAAIERIVPDSLARFVQRRLRRLPGEALAAARAIAVLGEGTTPARVAALAGLAEPAASRARAELAAGALISEREPRFVHPVVRAAVQDGLGAGEATAWHRRAAGVLAADGAPESEVAMHLLRTDPGGEPWAARALAAAATRAAEQGDCEVALRLLDRALAEPPPPDERDEVALAAALAAERTGAPDALERLRRVSPDAEPAVRVEAVLARARLLVQRDRAFEAAQELRDVLATVAGGAPELARRLESQLLDVCFGDERLTPAYLRRLDSARAEADRQVLAHLAHHGAAAGAPAGEVVRLALAALDGGALLLELGPDRYTALYAIEALLASEAADEARTALDQVVAAAGRWGSRSILVPLSWMLAQQERLFGDLQRAEDRAREGLVLARASGAGGAVAMTAATLAGALLDRGDVAGAATVLAEAGPRPPHATSIPLPAVRARLRLLQGDPRGALAEVEQQLERERRRKWRIATREDTRSVQAAALAALGRRSEACRVARDGVALAREREVAGALARARLTLAPLLDGAERLQALEAAVGDARRSPVVQVRAGALLELGAALRRAGRRSDSREPLREARDLAHRCGATALEQRAHDELVVAGARPQRIALSGVDALTAAERRVADLAASGLTNREIAERLFVTPKTVEVHLSRTYGKLGVRQRSQLAGALRP